MASVTIVSVWGACHNSEPQLCELEFSGTGVALDRTHILTAGHVAAYRVGNHYQPRNINFVCAPDGGAAQIRGRTIARTDGPDGLDLALLEVGKELDAPAFCTPQFLATACHSSGFIVRVEASTGDGQFYPPGEVVRLSVPRDFEADGHYRLNFQTRRGTSGGAVVDFMGRVVGLILLREDDEPGTLALSSHRIVDWLEAECPELAGRVTAALQAPQDLAARVRQIVADDLPEIGRLWSRDPLGGKTGVHATDLMREFGRHIHGAFLAAGRHFRSAGECEAIRAACSTVAGAIFELGIRDSVIPSSPVPTNSALVSVFVEAVRGHFQVEIESDSAGAARVKRSAELHASVDQGLGMRIIEFVGRELWPQAFRSEPVPERIDDEALARLAMRIENLHDMDQLPFTLTGDLRTNPQAIVMNDLAKRLKLFSVFRSSPPGNEASTCFDCERKLVDLLKICFERIGKIQ